MIANAAGIITGLEKIPGRVESFKREVARVLAAEDRSAYLVCLEKETALLIKLPNLLAPALRVLPPDTAAAPGAAVCFICRHCSIPPTIMRVAITSWRRCLVSCGKNEG